MPLLNSLLTRTKIREPKPLPAEPVADRRRFAPLLLGLAGATVLTPRAMAQTAANGTVPKLPITAGGTGAATPSDALNALGGVPSTNSLSRSGAIARPYLARSQDQPWSIPEFGSYGSTSTDHTTLVQKALSSGEVDLLVPQMTFNLSDVVSLAAVGTRLVGKGAGSVFVNRRVTGSAAGPLILVPATATDCLLQGLTVQAVGADKVNPTIGAGDTYSVPYGSAVIVCADRTTARDLTIYDAWDNGLSVAAQAYGPGGAAGKPVDFLAEMIRTSNCGCGTHVAGGPGRIGSGINLVSAANFTVVACIDRKSNGAVTVDDGGGATGRIIGCSSFESAQNGTSGNPIQSAAFYTGTNEVEFDGCQVFFPAGGGFWLAGAATVKGGLVVGANDFGILITRNHCIIDGVRFKEIGFRSATNTADVIRVQPIENIDDLGIENVRSWSTQANLPRYGYYEVPTSYAISADVSGRLRGRTANYLTQGLSRASDPRRIVSQQLGPTGYIVWSTGEIEQWGTVGSSGSDPVVTFPKAFPNAVWFLQAMIQGASSSASTLEGVSASTASLTGFTAYPRYNNGTTTARAGEPFTWYARGN
ncbi:hypothetical protein [Methylobacterium sp. C1]|uniref:gp53-like domain-containing protein n=1 Tax=Methylobacterium sp. C1 TaxID=1479019 RepID=UPI0008DA85D0|nr:hypothetical protein [Methylobacterium sp. C1]